MLGYTREEVCERDTNRLHFKRVREFLGSEDFFKRMEDYQFEGQKTGEFLEYQRLKFMRKQLDLYETEEIEEYSQAVAKLHQWT